MRVRKFGLDLEHIAGDMYMVVSSATPPDEVEQAAERSRRGAAVTPAVHVNPQALPLLKKLLRRRAR